MRAGLAILLGLLISASTPVFATETSFLEFGLGYPFMTIALDPRLQPNLNSKLGLQIGAWRTLQKLPLGLGLENTVFFGGDFGTYPILQSKVALTYFFAGRPIADYQINEEVVVKSRGWSPYVKFAPGLIFMNLRSPVYTTSFGASSPLVGLAAGITIPTGVVNHWAVELAYSTSINATDNSKSPISAEGYLLSVAYAMGLP